MRGSPLLLLLVIAACGDSAPMMDAGTDSGPLPDLGTDAGPVPSTLYGPCTDDTQCPGVGAVCRHNVDGWPSGYCTVPCGSPIDDVPCNDELGYTNTCADIDGDGAFFCERKCMNGIDCMREHYTCVGATAPADTGICVGVCDADVDCGDGAVCDDSGRCHDAATPITGGMPNGAACTRASDCRSRGCVPAGHGYTGAQPVGLSAAGEAAYGYVGGMCTQWCILPAGYNATTFFSSPDLPQGDCPTGEVCFPIEPGVAWFGDNIDVTMASFINRSARGDGGFCVPANCQHDTDCRPGYQCFIGTTAMTFSTGVCVAGCSRAACPTGTTCVMNTRGDRYFCS